MPKDLISKATRNEFREVLTGFVLREIDMVFDAADLVPNPFHTPDVSGQRRSLVEQYYANVDFASPADIKKLCAAFEEVIEKLRRTQTEVTNPSDVGSTIATLIRRMERDGFEYRSGRFLSDKLSFKTIEAASLLVLSEESILEHIEKAKLKIDSGDHSGAITSAYSLVEGFLKALLRKREVLFSQDEGDIRELYKLVADTLNLTPNSESLESYLKAILQGLKGQISGLYQLANKASDRHARRYNPARHHAKLAVNAALTLCEFLLESLEYQDAKRQNSRY